jgi:rSAM/selenodomain-associated transferase 1
MDTVAIFAKYPQPGQVKTRLAAAVSPAWAARVAEAFLLDTMERVASLEIRRLLVFTPIESSAYFAKIAGDRYYFQPQAEGTLGERLENFLDTQLRVGARAVIILGSDSPTVPPTFVTQALRQLEQADIVLGPATDGGYYLIGCARRVPPVFSEIPWGSEQVLANTVAALAASDRRLALLPPWYDVDTLADWHMLRGHVAAQRRAGIEPGIPHTERLLAEPLPNRAPEG